MSGHGLAVREVEQSSKVRVRRRRFRYPPVVGPATKGEADTVAEALAA
jgi:hypothetical protein